MFLVFLEQKCQRASEDSGYFIIGERANRSAPGTGEYKCKPKITDNEMNLLRSLARDIVNDMEETSWPVTRPLHFLKSHIGSPSKKGYEVEHCWNICNGFCNGDFISIQMSYR